MQTERPQALTHGRIVGVWEALVYPLSHEHPGVADKGALYDFVVVLLQILGHLQGGEREERDHSYRG